MWWVSERLVSEFIGDAPIDVSRFNKNGRPMNILTKQYSSLKCMAERKCIDVCVLLLTTSSGREFHQDFREDLLANRPLMTRGMCGFWQLRRMFLLIC